MSMGIGWPNASNQNAPVVLRSGRFNITIDCFNTIYPANTYTQYLTNTSLQEGDYVYSPEIGTRIPLGIFTDIEPIIHIEIDIEPSPVYTRCEA